MAVVSYLGFFPNYLDQIWSVCLPFELLPIHWSWYRLRHDLWKGATAMQAIGLNLIYKPPTLAKIQMINLYRILTMNLAEQITKNRISFNVIYHNGNTLKR